MPSYTRANEKLTQPPPEYHSPLKHNILSPGRGWQGGPEPGLLSSCHQMITKILRKSLKLTDFSPVKSYFPLLHFISDCRILGTVEKYKENNGDMVAA